MGDSGFIEFAEDVWLPWSRENKSSYKDDEYFIEAFREFFGKRTFAEISPLLIEKYKYVRSNGISKRKTKRSKATVNRELSALSKIFERAILERITMENPVRLVKKFKEDNERIRYFKPDEEKAWKKSSISLMGKEGLNAVRGKTCCDGGHYRRS